MRGCHCLEFGSIEWPNHTGRHGRVAGDRRGLYFRSAFRKLPRSARHHHVEQGQVPIAYILPTGKLLQSIGLHGGSGRLEDYGLNESVNARIHERNKKVCKVIGRLYNRYVNADRDGYVAKVKKTRNEQELRALRAPWAPYAMPAPAHATPQQLIEIYSSYDADVLKPWDAVARQLDKFANRMSEGLPFISMKAKYEVGTESPDKKDLAFMTGLLGTSMNEPIPTAIEVEGYLAFQFSADDIRTFTGVEAKSKASLEGEFESKDTKFKLGLEFKRDLKKPDEWEVTFRTGPLELEGGEAGKRKVAIEVFPKIWSESEIDPGKATFEGGLKIETKAIMHILKKLPIKSTALPEFVEKYADKAIPNEISIHAGFVGLTERTALSVVSRAPGFFDVRDPDVLVRMKWNTLASDEEVHLTRLGWDQCNWDLKSYADAELPKSMEEEWEEFTAEEQIATLFLGFHDADDYHKRLNAVRGQKKGWKEGLRELRCAAKEGEGEAAGSAE